LDFALKIESSRRPQSHGTQPRRNSVVSAT
jgi:hypothetical protein